MKKALKNHFKIDVSVQTHPDLLSSYFLEYTAQFRIKYTYDQLYMLLPGQCSQYNDLLQAEWSRDLFGQ
jgi:hypothetical protein